MSVKSDRWIRRMALERGMIEPFSEERIRNAGVISYGLSSYGYDMRIADEFKIFTNINSSIVDPKSFDPRSFVDFKGEVCMIPPNSFALARSVEYFRIPRNVITLCLGKCVAGHTRVVDAATGALRPAAEAVHRNGAVASLRGHHVGEAAVAEGAAQGVLPVYEITTRTGRTLTATPHHPLLTLGGWRRLDDLRPGERIGVPRRIPIFGRRRMRPCEVDLLGLLISEGQGAAPGSSPRGTSGDPVLRQAFARAVTDLGGTCVHHRWLEAIGLTARSPQELVPPPVFELRRPLLARFLRALFSGDGGTSRGGAGVHLEFCSTSEQLARDVQHLLLRFGIVAMLRRRETPSGRVAHVVSIAGEEPVKRFARRIGLVAGSRKQRRLEAALDRIRRHPPESSSLDALPAEAWGVLEAASKRHGRSLRSLGLERTAPHDSVPLPLARDVARRLGDEDLGALAESDVLWDVVRTKRFAGFEPVYDLTVPEAENFVGNDVLVHNSTYARCGIIVNVTPFEPEWEGIVTLEVSNTTPLPAKIYAGEGIAQVLFFESDEECETSYADKKGKYQGQQTLTLPKL